MVSSKRYPAPPKTAAELMRYLQVQEIPIVDLRFMDLPGTMQHFSLPTNELTQRVFDWGTGFDGSSIRGFQTIDVSDMLVVPDPASAYVDPCLEIPTLAIMCDVRDPVTEQWYSRDPRYIARKAEAFLKQSGIADTSYWGPELEFFIFDGISFHQDTNSASYHVESEEGIWNSGRRDGTPNLGYKVRNKEGYFPVPPTDSQQDLRSEMIIKMMGAGLRIEKHHHEVATAGQGEIGLRYDTLLKQADGVQIYKYVVKNVARAHGKAATFMPKPLFGDNGTGMHTHQSLWKDGSTLFYDAKGYAKFSQLGLWYIGGLLKHSPALLGLVAPTTNSYRRLVPGYEAPVNLAYSQRNRSASAKIPVYELTPESRRVEYRVPDPTCNAYLAFAAMLMAGIDGIINHIDPGAPVDKDIYELSPEEAAKIPQVPGSLQESLDALEKDHEFLLRGGVFTPDVIENWLTYKRKKELDEVRIRPHPYEFHLYFDA
ncbi:MAG: type I glutamate--ammonia ligase [Dehalococcoidia bacterium]|nr:type I glutamate--ammonia ligase [Dehalococcoidia bacterium]